MPDLQPSAGAEGRLLFRGSSWAGSYAAEYEHHSRRLSEERRVRRERERARRVRAGHDREEEAASAAAARERARSLRAVVDLRLSRGYVWRGGPFAGDRGYRRDAFVYQGLVSHEHALLRMWVASTRRARHLRTGEAKEESERSDSKLLALDAPYCESNKLVRRVLRVELDLVFEGWAGFEAWGVPGVPAPNLVVGHEDDRGRVHRPHLFWLIEEGVAFGGKGREKPRALFAAVLRSLTAELLPLGADPGGLSNGHRHKNPVSPLWHRRVVRETPYSLAALKAALPLGEARGKLRAAREESGRAPGAPIAPDHPDPEVAAGSNRLFVALSALARAEVASFRDAGRGSREEFEALLAAEALRACPWGEKAERAARRTANAVAAWTWEKTGKRPPRRRCADAGERARLQAEGGRLGAAQRAAKTRALVVEAARRLRRALGRNPTQAQVLAQVAPDGVRGEKTVRRHWAAVLEALGGNARGPGPAQDPAEAPGEGPVIQSAYDKKAVPPTAPSSAPSFSPTPTGGQGPFGPPPLPARPSVSRPIPSPPRSLSPAPVAPWPGACARRPKAVGLARPRGACGRSVAGAQAAPTGPAAADQVDSESPTPHAGWPGESCRPEDDHRIPW